MARPNWEYIRVDVLMPSNPKVCGLPLASRWLLVGFWCYCGQHLTDGFVPAKIWRANGRSRERQPLIDAGFAQPVDGGYQMHDYLAHQRSRAEVEALSRKRAEAGRKGGQAKANAVASAKQTPDGLLAEQPFSKPSKTVAEAEAEADRSGAGAVSHPSRRNAQGDDDEIDLIISEIRLATGRDVSRDHAADVRALLLNGRDVTDRAAYLRKIIRTERDPVTRFLPQATAHPSARPVAEAVMAAGITPNGTPLRGDDVAAIAARARKAIHAPKGDPP